MPSLRTFVERWGAATLFMLAIFVLSSRPSSELPNFGWADAVIKKAGHVLGYGMLALSYLHALRWRPGTLIHALALALLYGASDELHQAFVPGLTPLRWISLYSMVVVRP